VNEKTSGSEGVLGRAAGGAATLISEVEGGVLHVVWQATEALTESGRCRASGNARVDRPRAAFWLLRARRHTVRVVVDAASSPMWAFMRWMMPTLTPGRTWGEFLEFGAYGLALSRVYRGTWVGFKAISETVERRAMGDPGLIRAFGLFAVLRRPAGVLQLSTTALICRPEIETRLEHYACWVEAFCRSQPDRMPHYDLGRRRARSLCHTAWVTNRQGQHLGHDYRQHSSRYIERLRQNRDVRRFVGMSIYYTEE